MKESKYGVDKRLVFRETFSDEDSVRKNGGVPTNVVFENGVGKFNGTSSNILYNKPIKSNVSIRIRLNYISNPTTSYIYSSAATSYTSLSVSNLALIVLGGTPYVNGIAGSTLINGNNEIIISNYPLSAAFFRIASTYYGDQFFNGSIELFEIYQGTLTANEVKNLYENKTYVPMLPHGEILGPELITNVADRTFSSDTGFWNKGIGITINNGAAHYLNVISGADMNGGVVVIGRTYQVSFSISNYSSGGVSVYLSNTAVKTANGDYVIKFTSQLTRIYFVTSGTTTLDIDNVSIKEITSTANLILDVNAI